MPYTFKLSRRLAQIYSPAVLLGVVIAACKVSDVTSSDPAAPEVASFEVSPTNLTLNVGDSGQLTAIMRDPGGRAINAGSTTWASGDTGVALLDQSGMVTGRAEGTVVVSAASQGKTATASVRVSRAPVASVTVSPATGSISMGATLRLAAVTTDKNGRVLRGRTLAWTSSDSAVAGVNDSGLVTGKAAGSATITATSEGKSGSSTITVTVAVTNPATVTDLAVVGTADSGVTLSFTEVDDGTGQPASYDVRYAAGTITWGSTAPSVSQGTCSTPAAGIAIGSKRTCTVLGLTPGTGYQFQLVAFRGTLRVNAVFGGLSNVAQGSTTTPSGPGTGPQPGPTDTILFQDGFEGGTLGPWQQVPDNGRYSVTADPARVHSGTRSLQTLFTPTNGYGMLTRWFMPGYDEVYVKFYVLFQEGFLNQRSDGAGMHFLVVCGNRIDDDRSCFGKPAIVPNGTDYFYAGLDPEEVSLPLLQPFSFYTYWPDMSCCYGNMLFQQSPKTALLGGQWQEVVFHVKLNTPGQSNGLQEVWLNGVKKLSQQNLRWRTTTDLRLNEIRFDNYMPGGLQIQYLWLDDITVWRP